MGDQIQTQQTYPYDPIFQRYLLSLAVQDPAFLAGHRQCINPEYFEDRSLKFLSRTILEFYDQYSQVPSQASMTEWVANALQSGNKTDIAQTVMGVVDFLYLSEVPNADFVRDRAVHFARRQGLKRAVMRGIQVLREDGDPVDAMEMYEQAMSIGAVQSEGTDIREMMEKIPEIWENMLNSRGAIPTLFLPSFDRALYGTGPRRGELYVIQAVPKAGKCIGEDARVWDPERGYVAAREFNGSLVVGEQPHGSGVASVIAKQATGIKQVFDVLLRSGRVIRQLSANHGVRTARGYIQVKSLRNGDAVAAPWELPLTGSEPWSLDSLGYIVGCFLGDGCMTLHHPCLSEVAGSREISSAIVQACPPWWSMEAHCSDVASTARFVSKCGSGRNPMTMFLAELGILGHNAFTKVVPGQCWPAGLPVIAELLAGLWDTDGHVGKNGCCELTTASKGLADDVLTALHVLGIYARVSHHGSCYWRVSFSGRDNNRRFLEAVPIHVSYKKAQLVKNSIGGSSRSSYYDSVPPSLLKHKRRRSHKDSRLSRPLLRADELVSFAAGVHWDEVVQVRTAGRVPTFDLQIADHCQSFTCDGVILHNSMFMVCFGAVAVNMGFRVLHITIGDLKEFDVAHRYASRMTGIPMRQILRKDPAYISAVRNSLLESNRLRVKYYSPYTLTTAHIRSYMSWLRSTKGFQPDMLIVDYPDKMKYDRSNTYGEMGRIYMELKAILDDFNCVGWVASQSNRGAKSAKLNTTENMAESWDKVANADGIIPITKLDNQGTEVKDTENLNFDGPRTGHHQAYVENVRFGHDGFQIKVWYDFGRCYLWEDSPYTQENVKKTNNLEVATAAVLRGVDPQAVQTPGLDPTQWTGAYNG